MQEVREQETRGLNGRIRLRGEEGYEEARLDAVWHTRKPSRYPDAIVLAESERDVADAVKLARDRGWKVKARAGGHSWTASSVRDGGVLISLAGVNEWGVDPPAGTAWVQPGARGRELNTELARHGLFFPTGHCPTIAVGGFLLQGGWGWNSRKLGPACLSVVGVDVVTADGEVVHADENENPDLLWAARGAGSGFFGVVTKYYLKCHPRPKSMMMSLYVYPVEVIDEILRWTHQLVPKLPPALEYNLFGAFPRNEDGTPLEGEHDPVLQVQAFAMFDNEEESREALQLLETCPVLDKAIVKQTFLEQTLDELYDLIDRVASPDAAYAGDNMWTDASADELVPAFKDMVMDMPTPWSYVLWWPWVQQPLPNSALSITGWHYISPFSGWTDPADEARYAPWPGEHMRRYDHLSKGIQLADENLLGRPESRYMVDENAKRLEELRAKWDPEGRFHTFLFGDG